MRRLKAQLMNMFSMKSGFPFASLILPDSATHSDAHTVNGHASGAAREQSGQHRNAHAPKERYTRKKTRTTDPYTKPANTPL